GSNLWIDLNNNGSFEDAGELLVNNNNLQSATNASSASTLIPAGTYPIRIAYFNSGASALRVQASSSKHTAASMAPCARHVIPATLNPQNNVTVSGAGIVKFLGHNTYSGTTTVNAGTLEIDGANDSTAATTVVGTLGGAATLAGSGTLAGSVGIGAL